MVALGWALGRIVVFSLQASASSLPLPSSKPSPPPPLPLMEELVEEILLRFPPREPASLVRAALVCKQWRRLISGAGFRRRFREFHRTPPMLGFLLNDINDPACFVPTTTFCPPHADRGHWLALDARHGRVLLRELNEEVLMVWDPITDEQRELPMPILPQRHLDSLLRGRRHLRPP